MRSSLFLLFLGLLSSPVKAQGNTYIVEVYQTCNGSICSTFPLSTGSGVSVARTRDNHTILLTAAHVLSGLPSNGQPNKILVSQPGRSKLVATLEMKSDSVDIAALRVRQPLPHTPIVLDNAKAGGMDFEARGYLSERFQTSKGKVDRIQGDSLYSEGTWAHSGLSGGPLVSGEGVIGILIAKTGTGIRAVSPNGMKRCLEAAEKYTGQLYYASAVGTQDTPEYVPKATPSEPSNTPPVVAQSQCECEPSFRDLRAKIAESQKEIFALQNSNKALKEAVTALLTEVESLSKSPQLSEQDIQALINISLSQQTSLTEADVLSILRKNTEESPIDANKLNASLQSIGKRLNELEKPTKYVWFDSRTNTKLDEQLFPKNGPVMLDFNFFRKKMEKVLDE